jgi:hypothetical protein
VTHATECPHCDQDWLLGDAATLYGCDVLAGERDQFLIWQPCCDSLAEDVGRHGFEATYGLTVEAVAREIGGYDVLEVLGDGDGCVVARLTIVNPTTVREDLDRCGNRKAQSPSGWQTEIFADVAEHHSHHQEPNGWKFGIAAYNGRVKVGVMVVTPPLSRALMQAQPHTAEVNRGCILPARGPLRMNASSKLYSAACEQARQLGYDRVVSYTMVGESGHSLLASGFAATAVNDGGEWGRTSRSRTPKHSKVDTSVAKVRWERGLTRKARRAVRKAAAEFQAATEGRMSA